MNFSKENKKKYEPHVPAQRWEHFCTCSGITLCGFIPVFIHAKNCKLHKFGVQNWAEMTIISSFGLN